MQGEVPRHVQLHILRRQEDVYTLVQACGAESGCENDVKRFLQHEIYRFLHMVLHCILTYMTDGLQDRGIVCFENMVCFENEDEGERLHSTFQDIEVHYQDFERVVNGMNVVLESDEAPLTGSDEMGLPTDRFLIFLDSVLKDRELRRLRLQQRVRLHLQGMVESYLCSLIVDAVRAAKHRMRTESSSFPRLKMRDMELVMAIRNSSLRVPKARMDKIRLYRPKQSHPNRNNIPN